MISTYAALQMIAARHEMQSSITKEEDSYVQF